MTSESTEPRPRFVGTLRLKPKEPETPPPPLAPPSKIEQRVQDLATCRERFPALFDPAHPLPLAIGAVKALAEILGKGRAKRLLEWWCRYPLYLAAVAADGSRRYNLDGSDAGPVADEHRADAKLSAAARRSKTLAKSSPSEPRVSASL